MSADEKVFIWSGEWCAFWRPNGAGYTDSVDEAGSYDKDDALARTAHCGPEKQIRIVPAVPTEEDSIAPFVDVLGIEPGAIATRAAQRDLIRTWRAAVAKRSEANEKLVRKLARESSRERAVCRGGES